MNQITWEEVLKSPSFAQGEIEVQGSGKVSRGPIEKISTKGDDVFFRLLWCAHYDEGTKKWTVAECKTAVILKKSMTTMVLASDGHLILKNPEITAGKLFPVDGDRLDPAKVEGLDLNNLPRPQVVEMDVDE